jgi:protein-L-isoaspartate(D-aspartate) O-methyltransferase
MKADERGIGLTSQRARDRLTGQLREMGISSAEVLHVMGGVPRHLFVDEALASRAYENTALPIGHGQTVSQPYIVARMTEALLSSGPMGRVLEIGAGSGYQTAVLAHFAQTVYAVERLASLAKRLRERMAALHHHNVRVRHGDGHRGWPEHAPFDAVLAAAAVTTVPLAVCEQLELGGRMVIPVGGSDHQELILVTRHAGGFEHARIEPVRFVPMRTGVTSR